jgi:hypothetical protein
VFPDRRVFLVQSPVDADGHLIEDGVWTAQRHRTYAQRYIADRAALEEAVPGRRLYIGWTILPSLTNLQMLVERIPVGNLSDKIGASRFTAHLSHSWLWHDPAYELHQIAKYGHYRVYEVRSRGS